MFFTGAANAAASMHAVLLAVYIQTDPDMLAAAASYDAGAAVYIQTAYSHDGNLMAV